MTKQEKASAVLGRWIARQRVAGRVAHSFKLAGVQAAERPILPSTGRKACYPDAGSAMTTGSRGDEQDDGRGR
jgi:hypothetical protein